MSWRLITRRREAKSLQKFATKDLDFYLDHNIIYVTTEMDLSAATVLAGPNLNGRMDPGLDPNIKTEYMKRKYVCIAIRNILLRSSYSFKMVISGIKQHFTPKKWIANMSGIQIGTLFFLQW